MKNNDIKNNNVKNNDVKNNAADNSMGKIIMRADNLYFKYNRNEAYIIRKASFSIREGMLYGMVGRNSTGKSTLLKLLCGREDKHGGEITLDNHTDIIYLKKNVGIISEEQKLFKDLTVYENGIIHEKTYEGFRIEEFLEYINMYNINRKDRIDMLSASDKIKVKISLVLARHVKVILLDEPTGVLDVSAREDFMKLLRDITIEKNIAVIMATHLTDDLDKKADYIIFVNDDGTVEVEDGETINDKYMLLKGRKEDIAALPKEAMLSYEEKETSAAAMTACYDSIRDTAEGLDIITEIPDISTIMYYKAKAGNDSSNKKEPITQGKDEVKQKRAKSNQSTYKDTVRIYDGLFNLYGRKWGVRAFSIIMLMVWSFDILSDGFEWFTIAFLVVFTDMLVETMYQPKIIQIKEMYSEIKYLPVKTEDVVKYIMIRIALGVAVLIVLTGVICMARYNSVWTKEMQGVLIVCIVAAIYKVAELAVMLRNI